jgi:hypothetical protein
LITGTALFICVEVPMWAHAEPLRLDEVKLRGCWDRTKAAPKENFLTYCFHDEGQITGWFLEATGEAGELDEMDWRLKKPDVLLIDDWMCKVEDYASGQRFVLSSCPVAGEWRFVCADPDFGDSCSRKSQ